MHVSRVSISVLGAGVALFALDAHAQTTGPTPADDSGVGVEDIVVTAQRRGERLLDVPIAITAQSGEALAAANIRSTLDLPSVTPSLSFTSVSGGAVIFIRGVGNTNPIVGNEASIAVYVDGIYQPSLKGAQFSFNNIERIEVLKGPQGTLFGRNATGGAIQIVYRDPSHDPQVRGTLAYENYDTIQGDVYASTGLGDTLAIDVSGYYRDQRDGFGRYLPTGAENMKGHEYSGRSKLVWTPTETTKITLGGSFLRIAGSLNNSQQLLPGSRGIGGVTFQGSIFDANTTRPPVGRVTQYNAMMKIEQEASFANIVSLTGYQRTRSYYYLDTDVTPRLIVDADLPERQDAYSQEFQLQSLAGSRISWIAGIYLYRNISGFDTRLSGPGVAPAAFVQRRTRGVAESFAAFGQVTVPIAESTHLTLGGRYTLDDLRYRGTQQTQFGTSAPNRQTNSHSEPTWRISLDHSFGDTLLYASYNRGYKAGNFNLINVPSEAATQPEILDAYEIGLKGSAFDNRMTFSTAAFYYDYKNLQVLVNRGVIATTENAANARIKGLEGEITARPIRELSINVGVSYLDHEFRSYPNAVFYRPAASGMGNTAFVGEAAGNRLPRTPNWTLNVGAQLTIPAGFGSFELAVNNYYNPGFYWHPDNRIRQGHYDLLNAGITVTTLDDRWSFKLFGRNLLNEGYYVGVQESGTGDYGAPGTPRTYGVSVGVRF